MPLCKKRYVDISLFVLASNSTIYHCITVDPYIKILDVVVYFKRRESGNEARKSFFIIT